MSRLQRNIGRHVQPEAGDLLRTHRRGAAHDGVYVGGGKVIHYVRSDHDQESGAITETSLEIFSGGVPVSISAAPGNALAPREIAARARSALGRPNFRLFGSNCERFVSWCARGDDVAAEASGGPSSEEFGRTSASSPRPFLRIAPGKLPAVGDHLVTRRFGYTHHGIYVGRGKVIHYAGLAHGLESGPIEETAFEAFTDGRLCWVRVHPDAAFPPEEIAARARSRLGEADYCVLGNNCEHFAYWCVVGRYTSPQVDTGAALGGSGIALAAGLTARGAVSALGIVPGLSGAGVMSGLKAASFGIGGAAGGLVAAPLAAGSLAATALNSTILKDRKTLPADEREARQVGRVASHVGAAAGTAAAVGTVYASGAVVGLSATGISSGLAAVGSVVGGGMAAGVAVTAAAPIAAAAAVGLGVYKAYRWIKRG